MDKNTPDADLVWAIAHGSHSAMAELVHRFESPLGRYVTRICTPCTPYRDDILQEAFLKVYRNIHDFDPSLKLSAWMYRITHNVIIDHVRKYKQRAEQMVSIDSNEADILFESTLFRPEAGIETREFQESIRRILAQIPENQRAAFVLRFFEEKDYEEIGDILKQNSNTIATWIRRAREQFMRIATQEGLRVQVEDNHGSR
jgi:RNA polymerase sigma-70 factor (ECF subfamily)